MTEATAAEHEPATRKAMVRLLPIIGLAYFMSYVDRTNVALAKTALEADVGISAAAYGLGAGLFFASYALLEVPSNLVLYRVGPRVWITRIAITWGAVSAAMMFVSNEASFYVLRLLLGAAEAGLFPALMYMVTLWFSQKHRVTMVGLIYTAPCIAIFIGSPVGGALMELDGAGGLHGWQWMFLIEGIVTILVGGLVWFTLPDRPRDAKWLTPQEAAVLSERAVGNDAPSATRVRGNLRLAFGRPVILVLAAIYFVNQAISSGVGFNFPAVLQALGLESSFLIGVVAGSGGLAGLAGVLLFPWLNRRYGHEVLLIGICAAATLLIMTGFLLSTDAVWRVVLIFLSSFFALGTLPLFWSVAMSRMSGLLAAAGLAFINMLGITGGFVGPFVYGRIEDATGSLFAPYYVIAAAACAGLGLVPVLAVVIRREKAGSGTPTAADGSVPEPAQP
ncbi:MFS transporter [Actinoplanes friuliensis]|uniref:Major facilitator superfamily MFS_1 n=1 Tax=Actinoplanes friuliensis DSM 7358 TaxID=1246995 RepID=U5VYY4_9ACTN|nr:MFS transporter [Actinoplanes friuliensis]AGZ40886.1 Major facilitator superfamily MFS_1 [Actinoplanes friuliensis DSM 7358]